MVALREIPAKWGPAISGPCAAITAPLNAVATAVPMDMASPLAALTSP